LVRISVGQATEEKVVLEPTLGTRLALEAPGETAVLLREQGRAAGADWVVLVRMAPNNSRTEALVLHVPTGQVTSGLAPEELGTRFPPPGLVMVGGAGHPGPEPGQNPQDETSSGSLLTQWWFWTLVAGAVAASVAVAVPLSVRGEDRLRITVTRSP
jgi:hypothetical protein